MKKIFLLAIIILSTNSFSQSYKTAIGLKGGYPSLGGLNLKKMLSSNTAAELSVGGYTGGLYFSGLFEIQKSLPEPTGLDWYIGAGPAVGFGTNALFLSANGVIGVDYTFQDLPLNIALDTGPVISLSPIGFYWGGGLAVRYALK